ncbi:MAG: SpoIIE family protein phosphatase, partial [Planctomycetia bacterium]|nr:SpoIIE family protein phosphatase [Planctomycetia bacterium]
VEAAAMLRAARGVGGDLYDLFPLDRDTVAVIIGDVSGKGIPAALFMAVTETLQRVCADADMDPGDLATRLNSVLMANNEAGMFVTWWVGFLELSTGILTFTNAGHNPPLIRRADGTVERLTKRHGIPLAAMDNITYKSSQIILGPRDTLILYTDGVTEAFNTENEMFGDERLRRLLEQTTSETPQQLRDEVANSVKDFAGEAPQSDDITVLCVQYNGPPTNLWRKIELTATLENLPQIMTFVEEEQGFLSLSVKGRNQLMVCIEEIYTNIVNYACGGLPITVECCTDPQRDQVRVRFTDSGPPFNPLDQNPPNVSLPIDERPIGGLGIFIVRKWVDDLLYLREKNTNVLEIGKNISPPVSK